MHHRQVFQDRARATIVVGIAHAVLGDVERLVAPRALVDRLQYAIEAAWVDLTEALVEARIAADSAGTHEAMPKDLRRASGIEAHEVARIVVDAVIIARSDRARNGRKEHIGRKGEAPRLAGMKGGPVEERLLQARNTAIERR